MWKSERNAVALPYRASARLTTIMDGNYTTLLKIAEELENETSANPDTNKRHATRILKSFKDRSYKRDGLDDLKTRLERFGVAPDSSMAEETRGETKLLPASSVESTRPPSPTGPTHLPTGDQRDSDEHYASNYPPGGSVSSAETRFSKLARALTEQVKYSAEQQKLMQLSQEKLSEQLTTMTKEFEILERRVDSLSPSSTPSLSPSLPPSLFSREPVNRNLLRDPKEPIDREFGRC